MYILGMIILTFFAVIGAAHFISAILHSAAGYDEQLVMVLTELGADNAEYRLRNALSLCREMRCSHLRCECRDSEALYICNSFARHEPMIEVRPPAS